MMHRALLRTCATVSAAGLAVGLAACSSDDDEHGVDAMMLADADTPAGWERSDATEIFGDGDGDDEDEDADIAELLDTARAIDVEPAQCAPLEPSPLPALAMLYEHPETTAGAGFLPQDENDPGVVNAVISTDPEATGMVLPDDLGECSTFTRTSEFDDQEVTYRADASEAEVDGAEDVHVVTVVSDAEVQSGDDTVSVVVGTVDDVAFRVDASGLEEPQILLDLVDRQVDRIRGIDPNEAATD